MTKKLFSVAGITVNNGNPKVRFTNDMVRHVKKCLKNGATRVDFVDLPRPMMKIDALKHLLTLKEFQSDEDQSTISETLEVKIKEAARGEVKVKSKTSLDSIAARARKANTTVGDVLKAIEN